MSRHRLLTQRRHDAHLAGRLRYDPDVGYTQGLAFIVAPLLLLMPEEEAFCVLVRLMESVSP